MRALLVLALAALPVLAGCATAPPRSPTVADVAAPDGFRDLVATVYPAPRLSEYGDALLPLDGARIVGPASPDFGAELADARLDAGWSELADDGYLLRTACRDGVTIVLAAAKPHGGERLASALAQLRVTLGRAEFVREARVLDAPVFPLRGSKRPQTWERGYGANFAWEAKDLPEFRGLELVATTAPGSPLDATRASAERILASWRPWQARGVRRFCVKFDDVGFGMTPDTELYFGSYPVAVRSLFAQLRAGLRAADPSAVLYLLPQTYWWNDPRIGAYSRAIRADGGLGEDLGLVLTGPEIVSETIDAPGLAMARDRFGSVTTPALVYDNLGREGDWGPLTGRDPQLASLADGVFGERGTPVHRLTRLDWLWNPGAYDAERSWRRAILELAGPGACDALRAACDAFRRRARRAEAAALVDAFASHGSPAPAGPLPRAQIAALLRADLALLDD